MTTIEGYPQPEKPWDGMHGLRYTGVGIVEPYPAEHADREVAAIGLPPRLPGETWDRWSIRLDREDPVESLHKLTYDGLEQMRVRALEVGDKKTLLDLEAVSRARDRIDDTDARYNYFANQCLSDIEEVETRYGKNS